MAERRRSRSASRSRSRSRIVRSRSRTRSRSRHRSRTRSGSPRYSRFDHEGPIKADQIKKLLQEQEKTLSDLVINHKEELEEIVRSKTTPTTLKKKPLQKQLEFVEDLLSKSKKIKKNLKKKKFEKSLDLLEEVFDILEEKKEDLQIADISPHGWLAVSCVRNKSNLPKDLQKRIDKVNNLLDKQGRDQQQGYRGRDQQQSYRGRQNYGYGKRFYGPARTSNIGDGENQVRVSRGQRNSPQELLSTLGRQKRSGLCSFCSEVGHHYRECTSFWQEVKKSRDTNIEA